MKKQLRISIVCLLLFILLIVLLKAVDVAPIGPDGTSVGFSSLNGAVHDLFGGYHPFWYVLTEITGYAAIALAAAFAGLGLYQCVKRKSILKVDRAVLLLGALYVVLAVVYVLFEKLSVNFRPVLLPGDEVPEASFPSSHTMLSIVILGSAAIMSVKYIKDKRKRSIFRAACFFIMTVTVLGRLLSGVHWLTDILGGILAGIMLVALFRAVMKRFGK